MTKQEMVAKVATEAGINQTQAKKAVEAVFSAIKESAKAGNVVRVSDFGTFKVKTRAARTGVNPATKQPLEIPAKDYLKFTPSAKILD